MGQGFKGFQLNDDYIRYRRGVQPYALIAVRPHRRKPSSPYALIGVHPLSMLKPCSLVTNSTKSIIPRETSRGKLKLENRA